MVKDDQLLEKCNEIWEKVSYSIKEGFSSEYVYSEKYLKIKRKSYDEKINTNFGSDKKTKEGFLCICLSVILTVSVYRTGKSYYTEVLLEECKYVVQEKKFPSILLTVQKFPLMILMKKILMKKLLMKKIKY